MLLVLVTERYYYSKVKKTFQKSVRYYLTVSFISTKLY